MQSGASWLSLVCIITATVRTAWRRFGILNNAIYDESRTLAAENAVKAEASLQYRAALAALNDFTQAHRGEKDMSEADKELFRVGWESRRLFMDKEID